MWYGSGAVGEQLGRGAARSLRTAPRRSRAPVAWPAMASPHWDLGTSTVAPGGVTGRPGARPPPLPAAPRASPHHPPLASIRRSMPRGCLFDTIINPGPGHAGGGSHHTLPDPHPWQPTTTCSFPMTGPTTPSALWPPSLPPAEHPTAQSTPGGSTLPRTWRTASGCVSQRDPPADNPLRTGTRGRPAMM